MLASFNHKDRKNKRSFELLGNAKIEKLKHLPAFARLVRLLNERL